MTFGSTAQTSRKHVVWGCEMATERRLSTEETPGRVGGPGDSISTVLVPLGDFDYFSVRHFTDTAAAHMLVGTHRSVTLDLSAVPFCDSSIYSLFDWMADLPDELTVRVVTGPVIERVLGLVTAD